MDSLLSELICASKDIVTERVTGSRVVCKTPAYLFFVNVCPTDAAALCEAKIYDGHNDTEEVLLDFEAQYAQVCTCIVIPIRFRKGIYVEFIGNIKSITLHYLSVPE